MTAADAQWRAETYGKTGTLEVTAGVLALRAEASRLRAVLGEILGSEGREWPALVRNGETWRRPIVRDETYQRWVREAGEGAGEVR